VGVQVAPPLSPPMQMRFIGESEIGPNKCVYGPAGSMPLAYLGHLICILLSIGHA
jgi:hypothetical protein